MKFILTKEEIKEYAKENKTTQKEIKELAKKFIYVTSFGEWVQDRLYNEEKEV